MVEKSSNSVIPVFKIGFVNWNDVIIEVSRDYYYYTAQLEDDRPTKLK